MSVPNVNEDGDAKKAGKMSQRRRSTSWRNQKFRSAGHWKIVFSGETFSNVTFMFSVQETASSGSFIMIVFMSSHIQKSLTFLDYLRMYLFFTIH